MSRPTSVTVFGILNILVAIIVLIATAVSTMMLFAFQTRGGAGDTFRNVPSLFLAWWKISLVLGGVAVVLLVLSGIGLLNLRPWGRSLAIGYSVFAIVVGLLNVGVSVLGTMQQLQMGRDPEAAGEMVGVLIGGLLGTGIRLIYPSLLWYYMSRPHVMAAFAGKVVEPAMASWLPPPPAPWTTAEANNPYVSPPAMELPGGTPFGGAPSASESIVETLVPSQNGPALLSYYLGLFALIPCLGFPLGVAAVYFGMKGLHKVRENPSVRGGAHAWVGVICGSLFGLFNFLLLLAAIVGVVGAALRQ